MAVFVRPATWSYDQELFRSATADEDELEAMLGAIALADEDLRVVESNERPVAFAHTAIRRDTLRVLRLFLASGQPALELLRPLLARIEEEHAGRLTRLEIPAESIQGADTEVLRAVGLRRDGQTWTKQLRRNTGETGKTGLSPSG